MRPIKQRLKICPDCNRLYGFIIEKYNGFLPVSCYCRLKNYYEYKKKYKMKINASVIFGEVTSVRVNFIAAGSSCVLNEYGKHVCDYGYAEYIGPGDSNYQELLTYWLEDNESIRF